MTKVTRYISYPLTGEYAPWDEEKWFRIPSSWRRLFLPAPEYMGWARHRGRIGLLAYAAKYHLLRAFRCGKPDSCSIQQELQRRLDKRNVSQRIERTSEEDMQYMRDRGALVKGKFP